MKDIHMNPEEAVQAHCDLGATESIAMHFGVFQVTTEGIDEPAARLARALAAPGMPARDFALWKSVPLYSSDGLGRFA
jgi:L-ascorbate metabolism protein UlaG (beta-lactamase superfamily)